MARRTCGILAGLLLVWACAAHGADEVPAGSWKLSFMQKGQFPTFFIVKLESKDSKWTGSVVSSLPGVPASTIENVSLNGDRLRFTVKVEGEELTFEGKVSKESPKKILGTFHPGQLVPAQLEATQLKTLDPFEVSKEVLATSDSPLEVLGVALDLLSKAKDKKAKPEEARVWAAKGFKAAEAYGPRWQREIGIRIAEMLDRQEGFGPVAVEYARQTARLVEPTDEAFAQMTVLETLMPILKKGGKEDEAKEIEGQLAKLAVKDLQEYTKKMEVFKPEAYAGRKAKSERVALVELFTGAQCPPCVAADLAFDAVNKSYKPEDVLLLQYHLHIPGPDALANPDAEARQQYYQKKMGTPTVFFNGSPKAEGGGGIAETKEKFEEFRNAINPVLETPASVKVKASAVRKGNKIDITAEAADLDKPGEKIKLRLALVEETIRYPGTNGIRYHHHVVRALPGGPAGLVLKDKTTKHAVSVDLEELRKNLSSYLDTYGKERRFPSVHRPLDFNNLYLVAFVQNDENKEVLQAAQVKVRGENEKE